MAHLEQFYKFVGTLKLTPELEASSKDFLDQISLLITRNTSKVNVKTWIACAIYVAVNNSVESNEASERYAYAVTLSQILQVTDVNIMEFFQAMCCLKQNDRLTERSKQSLIAVERKYCIISAIFDKFENMMSDIINLEGVSQDSDNESRVVMFKAYSWYLFLIAKAKVFWQGEDFLATFHLLLCCIAEVARVTPSYILLPPLDNVAVTCNQSLVVLQVLSNMMSAVFDEAKVVYECWLHVASELMLDSKLPELLEIKMKYNELYLQSGDIDESLFLSRDWHIVPLSETCNQTQRKVPTFRRTLDTVQALYATLKTSAKDFSPSVKSIIKNCNEDPTGLICKVVQIYGARFASALFETPDRGSMASVQKRFELSVKYYYLVLDALVLVEAERLTYSGLTAFLKNEDFHRSLLACCTEVIIMSCGSVGAINYTPMHPSGVSRSQGMVFPWVLEVFQLKAYHFFKVIESFIKSAPTITHEIIKHLKSIEEKILLSLAWQSDSPVFESFSPDGLSPEATNEKFWSSSEAGSSSHMQSSSSHAFVVNLFINKASRLAGSRMKTLCNFLQVKEDMLDDIWICIEHIIYQKNHLLKDRHLDQIIMCCIYAVCKALDYNISFKDMIMFYMRLAHATENVYRKVLTEGKREYIIAFYNKVFTGAIQDYIDNQFPSKNKGSTRLNALESPLSPSYSIPGRRNIFISPLKQSPFKDPNEVMSQKTIHSYCIGAMNQPAKRLQKINEALRDMRPSNKSIVQPYSAYPDRRKKHVITDTYDTYDNWSEKSPLSVASAKKYLKFD